MAIVLQASAFLAPGPLPLASARSTHAHARRLGRMSSFLCVYSARTSSTSREPNLMASSSPSGMLVSPSPRAWA
eukprot:2117543-Rhodomonas_salina.3